MRIHQIHFTVCVYLILCAINPCPVPRGSHSRNPQSRHDISSPSHHPTNLTRFPNLQVFKRTIASRKCIHRPGWTRKPKPSLINPPLMTVSRKDPVSGRLGPALPRRCFLPCSPFERTRKRTTLPSYVPHKFPSPNIKSHQDTTMPPANLPSRRNIRTSPSPHTFIPFALQPFPGIGPASENPGLRRMFCSDNGTLVICAVAKIYRAPLK